MKLLFEELLALIEEPNQEACKKLIEKNKEMFSLAKGSQIKHHAWKGGYLDHITQVMNLAHEVYALVTEHYEQPFTLSDALLVAFLHDLEKPWKYGQNKEAMEEVQWFNDHRDFALHKAKEYGFVLTAEHKNALKYVHGEGTDYNPHERIQSPLSALVHCCDTISARMMFDKK